MMFGQRSTLKLERNVQSLRSAIGKSPMAGFRSLADRNQEVPIAENVICIHGFSAHWTVFAPCSLYLRSCGYQTECWGYSTLTQSIEDAATQFSETLTRLDSRNERFFVLAHSMGSIVTRVALQRSTYKNLSGLVFIAPPMGGSPVARLAQRFFKSWIPALNDLSSGPEGIHHRLQDELALPTLVIAARYDILIPLAATSLHSEHERVQFAGTHNSLLIDPRVFRTIRRFLSGTRSNES